MKKDDAKRGAVLQRDGETYAIAPHTPGGIVTGRFLRTVADVAEKYRAQTVKITGAQRIAIIGIQEEDIDAARTDLEVESGKVIGLCVRSVKICPGTTYCKRGRQDSIGAGLELDRRYHGVELPWKFKMGVSGCPIDCSETCIKDVGLVGTPKGWRLTVGGNGGARPELSRILVENLEHVEQAYAIIDRVVAWFAAQDVKGRLSKAIATVGWDTFAAAVLEDAGASN